MPLMWDDCVDVYHRLPHTKQCEWHPAGHLESRQQVTWVTAEGGRAANLVLLQAPLDRLWAAKH